jgi:hypothetical protein
VSGTLKISDYGTWMPPSWIYDDVITALADAVGPVEAALSADLRAGTTDRGVGFADLRDASEPAFEALLEAVDQLMHRFRGEARADGPDTADARVAVAVLSELRALLRRDARCSAVGGSGEIIVSDARRWPAPRWAYDLVRDNLLADILELPDSAGDDAKTDLRGLDRDGFARAVDAVDRLAARARGDRPAISWAPGLQEEFAQLVAELSKLLHADPRTNGRNAAAGSRKEDHRE